MSNLFKNTLNQIDNAKAIEIENAELNALFWEVGDLRITAIGEENIYFEFLGGDPDLAPWDRDMVEIFCKCNLTDLPEKLLRESILRGIK